MTTFMIKKSFFLKLSKQLLKKISIGLVSTSLFVLLIERDGVAANIRHNIHNMELDPEMTGAEYAAILSYQDKSIRLQAKDEESEEDKALAIFLGYGKRTLQWVDLVNKSRSEDKKISFSSEATQNGNSVSEPRIYSFQTISEDWSVLKTLMPKSLKAVVFENASLTETLPTTEREFIEWLSQVVRAYQVSARYKLLKPYKEAYINKQFSDVRGYLILKDEFIVTTDLSNWNQLSVAKKEKYKKALIYLCQNSQINRRQCTENFLKSEREVKLLEMRDFYFPAAKRNYDRFFLIIYSRYDVVWNSQNPLLFTVPFENPKNERVLEFLKKNIEDEFKWNDWKLFLNFVETNSNDITRVVFEEGATPHVDGSGNVITMDANVPFSEYNIQWTIRHEYGHTLGLPDCYHEFYDDEIEAFVSYQLDITNLMCSRRGHFKQSHFDELKRVYYKEKK